MSSHSSHHPEEVLLVQFSLYVHKGGLKPHSFHFFFKDLGQKEVSVHNLPANTSIKRVRNRLGQLAENCGGKVISVTGSSAVLRCANSQAALRYAYTWYTPARAVYPMLV